MRTVLKRLLILWSQQQETRSTLLSEQVWSTLFGKSASVGLLQSGLLNPDFRNCHEKHT